MNPIEMNIPACYPIILTLVQRAGKLSSLIYENL
jgi:hypothetical protein